MSLKIINNNTAATLYNVTLSDVSLFAGSRTIFEHVDTEFSYDGIVLIKGAVGTGKSTLLKMIAGLIVPKGEFSHTDSAGVMLEPIYLHSQPEFNFVTGYVMDELRFAGVPLSDFAHMAGKSVSDLSGGEMKKISITMALKSEGNSAVLLDEPLDMLDDIESKNVAEMIIAASKTRPFIIATHDSHFDTFADVVIRVGDR